MSVDTQGDRMKRYRAQKGPERLRRCPGCGAVDRSCNYDCSAENAGISGEEYVRADFHLDAGWALNDAVIDVLRAYKTGAAARLLWDAVETYQANAPERGQ